MKAYLKFYSFNGSYVFSNETIESFSNKDIEIEGKSKKALSEKTIKLLKSLDVKHTPSGEMTLLKRTYNQVYDFLKYRIEKGEEEVIEGTAGLLIAYFIVDESKLIKL